MTVSRQFRTMIEYFLNDAVCSSPVQLFISTLPFPVFRGFFHFDINILFSLTGHWWLVNGACYIQYSRRTLEKKNKDQQARVEPVTSFFEIQDINIELFPYQERRGINKLVENKVPFHLISIFVVFFFFFLNTIPMNSWTQPKVNIGNSIPIFNPLFQK